MKRKKDPERREMEALVTAAIRNYRKMTQSAMCLVLFTEHYEKDPVALMQFALAILLDKPLYLTVPRGRLIPANVRAVAAGLEEYEDGNLEDLKRATERLLGKATKGM